ncbi:MAG: aldo/keto reductase [Neisseriaceae bacterium]|nr:aldo/keto reductase [Neisseriaceae bacterium]
MMNRRQFMHTSAVLGATAMFHSSSLWAENSPKTVPQITLNNGVKMPIIGLGVWKITDLKQCQQCVEDAFSVGYRLIDTAQAYGNEAAVGAAFHASGLKRDEVFIESKISPNHISEKGVLSSFEESIKRFKLDYVDLFLLHTPMGDAKGAWKALCKLYRDGRVRSIGVSNFYGNILRQIASKELGEVVPALNQIETHPYLQHFKVQETLKGYGIAMQAWSQFGNGVNGVLNEPVLKKIGEKYGKTAAQVILRWLVQRGVIVIPKTTRKERMIENISIFDFALNNDDLAQIAKLEKNQRIWSGSWGREDI